MPLSFQGLDAMAHRLIQPPGAPLVDFALPAGEAALVPPDSVSWRVFRNPVAMFVGGVAAVILELAEPAVRSGVWDHSGFRSDPARRLRRTGLAAMVTVYGAASVAEKMIAGVVGMHERVQGTTSDGQPYRANDVRLLTWVQVTAGYGFLEAYARHVRPVPQGARDRFYAEGAPAARLYGALGAPASEAEVRALFEAQRDRLEPSPIIFEFLDIMKGAPVLPAFLRPLQRLLVRAAVELVPPWVRERLQLGRAHGLRGWEARLVSGAGALADRIVLRSSPATQACRRLGLPEDYLLRERPFAQA